MDKEAQQKLNAILSKDISAITQGDLVFLRARSYYLTEEQKRKYFAPEQKQEVKKELTYRELFTLARSMGHKIRVGIKKDDLIALVGNH